MAARFSVIFLPSSNDNSVFSHLRWSRFLGFPPHWQFSLRPQPRFPGVCPQSQIGLRRHSLTIFGGLGFSVILHTDGSDFALNICRNDAVPLSRISRPYPGGERRFFPSAFGKMTLYLSVVNISRSFDNLQYCKNSQNLIFWNTLTKNKRRTSRRYSTPTSSHWVAYTIEKVSFRSEVSLRRYAEFVSLSLSDFC